MEGPRQVHDLQLSIVSSQVVDDAKQVSGGKVGDEPDKDDNSGEGEKDLVELLLDGIKSVLEDPVPGWVGHQALGGHLQPGEHWNLALGIYKNCMVLKSATLVTLPVPSG